MHSRDHRRIRPMLDFKLPPPLLQCPLRARLLQFPFLNLEFTQLKRRQFIQNSLAIHVAVTRTPKHQHITPILK